MVWALVLLLMFPSVVIAEPVENTVEVVDSAQTDSGQDNSEVVDKLQDVKLTIEQKSNELEKSVVENTKALGEIKALNSSENDTEVLKTLEDINGKMDTLILDSSESVPETVKAVSATNAEFSAYSNVLRSGQFAQYAAGMVPKVKWSDDYVFLQDSSSSYVFVSGLCDFRSSGEFSFSNASFTRWYYSGAGSGYIVQHGAGDVVVHAGGYTVLSSAGDYPLLDEGVTLLRNEVAFYAICAACLYCLGCVRRFLVRS